MSRRAHARASCLDDASATDTLGERWSELYGTPPLSGHLSSIMEQAIAWREQAREHGDASVQVRRDLAIVAREVSAARRRRTGRIGTALPQAKTGRSGLADGGADAVAATEGPRERHTFPKSRDRAGKVATARTLPPASSQLQVGARLLKQHGGQNHVVEVTADGMLYDGQMFSSLSAVAKHITGTHWNGLLFFGLRKRKVYDRTVPRG